MRDLLCGEGHAPSGVVEQCVDELEPDRLVGIEQLCDEAPGLVGHPGVDLRGIAGGARLGLQGSSGPVMVIVRRRKDQLVDM